MTHKIRQNVGKKIKLFSELFINNIFEYTFVSFEHNQTIGGQQRVHAWSREQRVGSIFNVQNCQLEGGRWSKLGKIWST